MSQILDSKLENLSKDDLKLWKLRHTAEHVLHQAVKELYPSIQLAMGPATEEGFYFDFDPSPKGKESVKISIDDFGKLEKRMQEIIYADLPLVRKEVSVSDAKLMFLDNPYKMEWVKDIQKRGEKITVYWTGKPGAKGSMVDLCAGPHAGSTGKVKAFKLLSVAGAYWHGDEKNKMLTRIYGTAFPSKKELDEHLWQLEEAKKRDHRKIGKEMELFMLSDEVGPGLPLWLPKGTVIKDQLEQFAKEVEAKNGYERVSTPHITKEGLYLTSGHLPYYAEDMFPPMEYEGENYYLKPMNCPHMHMIYKFKPRSYKDLPIRFAEYGTVYRREDSGSLIGILRVRGHTTNDAHIYCIEEQVVDELVSVLKLHEYYYKLFGIKKYYVELALPDWKRKKDKYIDDPKAWENSVTLLRRAAKESGIDIVEKEGAAAFYGPKFDFNITSAIGREFGASTNQLDFGSGKKFKLAYIDKDGLKKTIPYIIHRAPLGSHERFIGFLIEHFAGAFPVWLSPVQVKVLPLTERNGKHAAKVVDELKKENIRVEVDERNETLQAKIRDAQLEKVPYMLIVGDKEEKSNKVAVRLRSGKDLGQLVIAKFIERVKEKIDSKSLKL